MKHFRNTWTLFAVAILCLSAAGQRTDDILATSTGTTYKVSSLSPNGQRIFSERRQMIAESRTRLLAMMISDAVLNIESKAQNTTREKLLEAQKAKLPVPTAGEILAVYNANRDQLGGRTLDESRQQIIDFLKHEAEDKLLETYIDSLRSKYKVEMGKDVNGIGLAQTEVLVTIGAQKITLRDFDNEQRFRLNDIETEIFEEIRTELESSILSALAAEEAKSRNIDISEYIGAEVTDKLRDFTEEERAGVESDLMRRLFTKYNVKILLSEPTPIVHNVLVESDDPQIGTAAAPVTVVMFTDFQCPACARTHPVLKQAIAVYGDKVRLVVRDFPLEIIHKDAFNAALAVNAARSQRKFLEYAEILYRNQSTLDRASLVKFAGDLGLNVKQFELEFGDAKTAAEVRKDQADGRTHGITGTPTIFVNGIKVHRLSIHGFRSAIDRALKK